MKKSKARRAFRVFIDLEMNRPYRVLWLMQPRRYRLSKQDRKKGWDKLCDDVGEEFAKRIIGRVHNKRSGGIPL